MVTPDQRREALAHVQAKGLSGRAACRWTGLSRSVLRYSAKQSAVDQQRLIQMRQASQRQPRFGYRRVALFSRGLTPPAHATARGEAARLYVAPPTWR
jgi:putative transposase